ncbi:hypothetical protein [Anabaena azotica]|uniref:Uncharacterized protein n=1 Tax=Anabaena azotica FACHB-119 TaxID=947527 RepID=A0ABR8D6P1_9NOST|nr:hypothetical protein [Anabaena azotica]MBD2502369.1 hypothetical protein [Anabaena azotica FACHB-119]
MVEATVEQKLPRKYDRATINPLVWILAIASGIVQYALAFWLYLQDIKTIPVSIVFKSPLSYSLASRRSHFSIPSIKWGSDRHFIIKVYIHYVIYKKINGKYKFIRRQ